MGAESVTLYLGDCLDILPTLGKVDAVVTDPPYGMGKAEWDMAIVPVVKWLPIVRSMGIVAVFTGVRGAYDYPTPDWIMAWVRLGSTQRNGVLRGFNNWEPILVYGAKSLINDVISCPNFPDDSNDHPTPKPLKLMCSLLTRLTPAGATVLDPFMGSGTTGVACVRTGRRFIGIEIDPGYFAIAQRRIAEAQMQPPLFPHDEPGLSMEQARLDML